MANSIKPYGNSGLQVVTLDTSGSVILKNAMGTGKIGSFKLQFEPGGAAPGSVVISKRLHGAPELDLTWINCLYYDESTTTVPSAGDPVSTAMEVVVVADRDDVRLTYTSGVDGMTVLAAAFNG
jgi:hypothetical protein